jgi:hypothetical protein
MRKAYYMTPVDALITMIQRFIEEPTKFNGEYAFGSAMAISRSDLKHGIHFEDAKRVYASDMERAKQEFHMEVSDQDIGRFTEQAREWVKKIK